MTTPTVAVLDANGIIGLAKADCFPLLQQLFTAVYVPSSVVAEITDTISQSALQAALGNWLTESQPDAATEARVFFIKQEADRHVLALALEQQVINNSRLFFTHRG